MPLRQRICIYLNRQKWIDPDVRYWWTKELLRDFAEKDRNRYHRFLWSNHMAYAVTYELNQRYGVENMVASRRIFFSDLRRQLIEMGINPERDIGSVFEVGCSSGYQLRYLESNLFASATELVGIDIDRHAIIEGQSYLQTIGSKVRLICEDMANIEALLEGKTYDIVVCCGVLMYLQKNDALRVMKAMLKHSRVLVALTDPGYPNFDNARLEHSLIRELDGSYFHNLDAMVDTSEGKVLTRRWEGDRPLDGQRIYFVFAQNVS